MQNGNGIDLVALILLIIAIVLTALLLYVATRLITGKKELETPYLLRLILVAVLIWVAIIAVNTVLGALGDLSNILGLTEALPIIIFCIAIYLIKMFLLPATSEGGFERSIWIALLTFIFIYIVNGISGELGYELIGIITI